MGRKNATINKCHVCLGSYIKIPQNWNPSYPKCRKVWISRKNRSGPISSHLRHFSMGRKKYKQMHMFCYFPWWSSLPYSPGLGPCKCCGPVVATLAAAVCLSASSYENKNGCRGANICQRICWLSHEFMNIGKKQFANGRRGANICQKIR